MLDNFVYMIEQYYVVLVLNNLLYWKIGSVVLLWVHLKLTHVDMEKRLTLLSGLDLGLKNEVYKLVLIKHKRLRQVLFVGLSLAIVFSPGWIIGLSLFSYVASIESAKGLTSYLMVREYTQLFKKVENI